MIFFLPIVAVTWIDQFQPPVHVCKGCVRCHHWCCLWRCLCFQSDIQPAETRCLSEICRCIGQLGFRPVTLDTWLPLGHCLQVPLYLGDASTSLEFKLTWQPTPRVPWWRIARPSPVLFLAFCKEGPLVKFLVLMPSCPHIFFLIIWNILVEKLQDKNFRCSVHPDCFLKKICCFMYLSALPMCMYVHWVSIWQKSEESVRSPVS